MGLMKKIVQLKKILAVFNVLRATASAHSLNVMALLNVQMGLTKKIVKRKKKYVSNVLKVIAFLQI